MKLSEAAKLMNAEAVEQAILEAEFGCVSIDSRKTKPGDLFFAFSQPDYRNNCFNGDFEDATVYVPTAFENGAIAAVVRPDRFNEHKPALEPFAGKLLLVGDAIYAFQLLAKGVYQKWNKPVVGITGSAGKTTAKEITAHLLRFAGKKVLSNEKNHNNNIGHPLTVLKLLENQDFDLAVLEMAMSTPYNEIARLCRITPPDVAVVLNVLPVHIEHLGSIENIAKAKAEIVEGMKPGGVAILNADDFRVSAMRSLSKGETITYGIERSAEVMAEEISFGGFGKTTFTLKLPSGSAKVNFPLDGKHNVMNALAASAVGYVFGMSAEEIAEALSKVTAPEQRGEILRFEKGFVVVNDSYNSNPDALLSMVKTIVENGKNAKRKIVMAGEMMELGTEAEKIHYEVGKKITESGVDFLVGVGSLAKRLIEGAKEAGLKEVEFFEDSEKAGDYILGEVKEGDLILVKGSRSVRMEKIVEKLRSHFDIAK
ncbi:MAG: UDP-N-acetylmuramoyl-tripeptide--D-alanyl-D-alanine ligase [Acidobacteria bacterium]|jgi:UDP-N-acetylmuramoyl-tripeptide--D-alanyl-D-alanine ligase|nr:MAG: UDP-N-acetylmuramoyl-tripeptide--D-alanyl-D-alanine ligase [Acidobacteriota bacterium]GIU82921.1 MAG: UDP-N-acetylmuramoyl-tripeptide--D-alanyl-D-alanine ligase [Pyrinomonadaceae bacterium]